MASQVVLSVALIPLIGRTDTGHRNSEIYQAIQIGVLQSAIPLYCDNNGALIQARKPWSH